MSPVSPTPSPSVCRTFGVSITLLGLVAAGEIAALCWNSHPAPKPPTVQVAPAPTPAPVASATPEPPKPEESPAADAEKELLARLPKPTPTPPVRREVTIESRVMELVAYAKALRDRGDTATAMTRLREAQSLAPKHCLIISEMALTYEKMGLTDKALEQWRRIYEMGESAGIYYAAAEAKLKALQFPEPEPSATPQPAAGSLTPNTDADLGPVLSLDKVGTTDDTGNTQALRRLKLRVPILARQGKKIEPREAVIQVFFYDQLRDGSIVETNANVTSSWARRESPTGDILPVDWSSPDPEVLEVEYAQPEYDRKDPRTRERRNYFGYSVRVYYKGQLNAKYADPIKLLNQFIPPSTLPTSDLPQ